MYRVQQTASTECFAVKKAKVFFSFFLLFATGFINPVNKDYQKSCIQQKL